MTREFIARALDTTDALTLANGASLGINPQIWDFKVRDFEKSNLVFANLAEFFDMTNPSASLTVTLDETPSAAAAVADTADVAVTAFSTRQVTFTPTEVGDARQATKVEMETTFFPVMERASRGLGYALALKKEQDAYTTITGNAANSVIVNDKAATSDLASTDTMNYEAITKAISENEDDLYTDNRYLVVNFKQKQQLLKLGTINKANEFGTRDAIQRGLVGELFGLQVIATQNVTTTSNVAAAVVLGVSASGENALGYAVKREAEIETEYHALGRYYDIVGTSVYDFQALHPKAMCLIYSYA